MVNILPTINDLDARAHPRNAASHGGYAASGHGGTDAHEASAHHAFDQFVAGRHADGELLGHEGCPESAPEETQGQDGVRGNKRRKRRLVISPT